MAKEDWLRKHIIKNACDKEKLITVFNVIVTVFPEKRLDYIIILVKIQI